MLSQIVWVMRLAQHCLLKVAKNCQKKPKINFSGNYYTGSDKTGADHLSTIISKGTIMESDMYVLCIVSKVFFLINLFRRGCSKVL